MLGWRHLQWLAPLAPPPPRELLDAPLFNVYFVLTKVLRLLRYYALAIPLNKAIYLSVSKCIKVSLLSSFHQYQVF